MMKIKYFLVSLKYFFPLFFVFSSLLSQKGVEDKLVDELNIRNISNKNQAINELNKNGISIQEATELAKLQGIDLDTFLANNFKKSSQVNLSSNNNSDVIDSIEIVETLTQKDTLVDMSSNQIFENSNDYFGYEIFENNPFAEKNYLIGNIDEGYLLAPGDELRITVYGNNALTTTVKIDLNGNIIFPELGVFQAAGNTLKTLKSRLKIFLGKFYNGLVSSPQKAFLDISLTQIRPVTVNVLGEALAPGPHLVNGLASVLNAIYSAGGIKTTGSLRKVLLYRNNKLIKEFDLYNYITKGKIDSDIRLMNSDIIFIPPRLSSISLLGTVKRQGIFELKDGEYIEDLFKYSGGTLPQSALDKVNISRITPSNKRDIDQKYNRYLSTINYIKNKKLVLTDGDVISVPEILSKRLNEVSLSGNVNSEGIYSILTYPDLKSLIELAGNGPSENTYFGKVDIFKEDLNGLKSFKSYDLKDVLDGKLDVILEQNDSIRIYSLEDVEGQNVVSISGFGAEDKQISWRENFSLYDLIFESTSLFEPDFKSKLLSSRIDVLSFNPFTGNFTTSNYSLDNIIQTKKYLLKPMDRVKLYSKDVTQNLTPTIIVTGSVKIPTALSLRDNMFVEDAILEAGGFEDFADQKQVDVVRMLNFNETGKFSETIKYSIDEDYLLGVSESPQSPLVLVNNDVIVIRTPNRNGIISTVSITGEIKIPGTYSFDSYETKVEDIIQKSGGLTQYANLNSTVFLRDSDTLIYKKAKLLNRETLKPLDQIIIGSNLFDVETSGSGIINPSKFSWQKGRKARFYIKKSGGPKKRSEKITVYRKNGSSKTIKSFLSNPRIFPGDIINIELKPPKPESDTNFQDEFIRVFSIITSTLTTILLVTKL